VIGFVFTEFLDFVDTKFTPGVTEDLVDACALPSGGAYTTVGNYDHFEMFALVNRLSEVSGLTGAEILRMFGTHMLDSLMRKHATALAGVTDPLSVIEALSQNYDADVLGLYPNADAQALVCRRLEDGVMEVTYRSRHRLADVIEGLITGVFTHFKTAIDISRHDEINTENEQWVRFLMSNPGPQAT